VADPYYSEALGLGDSSWPAVRRRVLAMDEFSVCNVILYSSPAAALRILASTTAAQRTAATLDAVKGMEAALAAGMGLHSSTFRST
jgi:hypothetical protein